MIVIAWVAALVVAVSLYHRLSARSQIAWLLLCSYVFYAWWAWRFLPVLLALTLATYVIATRIARLPARDTGMRPWRRAWLSAGIALNVGALACTRYGYRTAPFAEPFAVLGISFYALQAVAYLVDTYSGVLRASHTLADFALYLAYFPKIVAGPIERPQAFLAQLTSARVVDDERLSRAAMLIAVGMTRKLVLADPLARLLPRNAFEMPGAHGGIALWAAMVGYAFVLYNDFAGYTSIARGLSGLFGIDLSRNFAQPFAASSFVDLWNRWHITFSHWLRDYIYLPLSRVLLRRNLSRTNVANLLIPPLTTMVVCGIWHGASVHMLLWGSLHGIYLVTERAINLRWPTPPKTVRSAGQQMLRIVFVFTLSCWTLVMLRLPVANALQFWQRLLTGSGGALPDARLLLFMLPSIWLDWMQSRFGEDTILCTWPRPARAAALAFAVLLWLAASGAVGPTPFVYQGF